MISHGVEISIARGVPIPRRFFFFFFFLHHVFIVFRYKKLRGALAMENTKPINQKQTQKKPQILFLHAGKPGGRLLNVTQKQNNMYNRNSSTKLKAFPTNV